MASRRTRRARQRVRALEAALADRSLESQPPLRKSTATMGSVPVPRTSSSMVEPIYPVQVPALEPWRFPEQHGAYTRGRLWNSYGSGVSFEMLRLAVKRCLLLQAIHQVCQHDILQLSKRAPTPEVLGWRVQHQDEDDETVDTTANGLDVRCDKAARMLLCPHPVYEPSFRGFLAKVMDDYLTLNRVAIELVRNGRGQVVQFRAIDAATILPTYRVLQRFVGLEMGATQRPLAYDVAARLLERETGMPLLDSEYVCVMRGQLVGTFAPGELLVWEDQPVTDVRVMFPPSYVERALEGIISWIYAFQYNRAYFSQGNPTEVILGITGDIQDDSFVALQEQLRENFSGIKGAWRVPLVQLPVDGQLSVLRLKENHKDMLFDEYMATLASLACAIYRTTPQRINLQGRDQQNRAAWGGAQHELMEESKEESFLVHSAFLAEKMTGLVKLVDSELEFVWTGLDITNREEEIKIEQIEVTTTKTVNEIRVARGDEPLEGAYADLPLNPLIFQAEGLAGGMGGGMGGEKGMPGAGGGASSPREPAGAGGGA